MHQHNILTTHITNNVLLPILLAACNRTNSTAGYKSCYLSASPCRTPALEFTIRTGIVVILIRADSCWTTRWKIHRSTIWERVIWRTSRTRNYSYTLPRSLLEPHYLTPWTVYWRGSVLSPRKDAESGQGAYSLRTITTLKRQVRAK